MNRRLFWKILIGFWLTFMLAVEGVWIVMTLSTPPHRPPGALGAERLARLQLSSAVAALRYGGLPAVDALVSAWPDEARRALAIAPAPQAVEPAAPLRDNGAQPVSTTTLQDDHGVPKTFVTTAQAPDLAVYRVACDVQAPMPRRRPGPLSFPPELPILGTLGGLVFSAVLAWYLARPIQRLRNGFERFARGDLDVRLQPSMGRRRDEIADLARDFDLMADRLQQLVQARDQLLHDVSHELRSPLARLHMAIGLVRQDPQRLETSLARVEAEAKRLDEMVDELLTLSRMEAGAPRLDDFFDPAGLVLAVAGDARFEAQETGVQVETVIDPHRRDEVPTVKGNAELVRRALENVVRNGLHHSRPGQRVVVGIAPDWTRRCFVIQVADEGPGVEPAALSVMFEPFVQGPGTAERRGFGLGLAIARRAVLAHGGSIEAGNRPEGGLAVTIRLPFGPMAAAAPDGAEPVADARSKA